MCCLLGFLLFWLGAGMFLALVFPKWKHKPYIITLRGMLYPQALKKSFLWKKIEKI